MSSMNAPDAFFASVQSEEPIDGASLLPKREPHSNVLLSAPMDAAELAMICHEQIAALSALAGMARSGDVLSHDEWRALLDPIAGQLRILRRMLEHDLTAAEYHLLRARG